MINVAGFYSVLKGSIERKVKTRLEYETIIAQWLLMGWLETDEAAQLVVLLDKNYPVTPPVGE